MKFLRYLAAAFALSAVAFACSTSPEESFDAGARDASSDVCAGALCAVPSARPAPTGHKVGDPFPIPAPGSSGNVLTSNGSAWTSATSSGGGGTVPTGTGFVHITSGSQDSAARTLVAADLPTIALTGNVTGSASGGSIATTYATALPQSLGGTGQTAASSIPLAGDVGGTVGASTVNAISGSTPILVTPAELRWSASDTPLLDSTISASGAGRYFDITAQTAASGSGLAGGYVQVKGGAGDGAGATGGFTAYDGTGALLLSLASSSGDTIKLGSGTQTHTLSGIAETFGASVSSPKISQSDLTTNSGTGGTFTIQAQKATGTTSIGGTLNLQSGSGTTAPGDVAFYDGTTRKGRFVGAQQGHLQVGDGGGDATSLISTYDGYVINDSSFGTSAFITSTNYTFFGYPNTKSFLLVSTTNLGFGTNIIPLVVVGSTGAAMFQRSAAGVTPPANTTLSTFADVATTTPLYVGGIAGQTADLINVSNSTPTKVFRVTPSGNVGIGAAGTFGSATGGVVDLATASGTPTCDGHGHIFINSAGGLSFMGASCSLTTIAPP